MALFSLSTKCFGKHLLKAQMQNAFRARELLPDCEPKKFPTTFFLHKTRNLEAHLAWNTPSNASVGRGARCPVPWQQLKFISDCAKITRRVSFCEKQSEWRKASWSWMISCFRLLYYWPFFTDTNTNTSKIEIDFLFQKCSISTFLILTENSSPLRCF